MSRLREAYGQEISAANVTMQQQKEQLHSLSAENDAMRELLAASGIPYEAEVERRKADILSRPYQFSPLSNSNSASSQHPGMASSGSQMYTSTPPTTISNGRSPQTNGPAISPTNEVGQRAAPPCLPPSSSSHSHESIGGLDRAGSMSNGPVHAIGGIFEQDPQLQIDFILTCVPITLEDTSLTDTRLEGPCREHTDYLCRRSITEADDEDMPFSGHALMATCPPPSYVANTTPQQPYPHKVYDLPHANLTTLLNLSRQLVTEGQITPIMALQCLKSHDMYRNLSREDVRIIIETLNAKVRCYGFGACVEDFELMDCLSSVLGPKADAVGVPAPAAARVGDI